MRLPNRRFRLIGCLLTSAVIAVAATTASQAQFRTNSLSVGPRAPMMSPSFRSEPRFQRFNNNAPDDLVVSKGKSRGKGKASGVNVSSGDPNSGDGRPPRRRPPRGKHPPVQIGPAVGTGTGVAIGTLGPAGAGALSPTGGTVAQRGAVTIPPANENRFVKDEVVLEFASTFPQSDIALVLARHGLVQLEAQTFTLTDTIVVRARIANRRSVRIALRGLGSETAPLAIQCNYLFRGAQQDGFASPAGATPKPTPAVATAAAIPSAGDPAQYALGKLHINQAHTLATGEKVLIAVIDSGIDLGHPELKGVVAGSFDALGKPERPHMHGTAIAGAIAAHARLMGAAPAAKILAIRAFGPMGNSAEATTFAILKGVEYASVQRARIINMSFTGPRDPSLARALSAAKAQGAVLVAASGNFGPKSPPQFPASDPDVIAVSATDANDKMFRASNVGPHIAVAAPGVDILLPVPGNHYETISGTSFSAAYVSGVAALVIQRAPGLAPDAVRNILESTAKDLGPRGKDPAYGAGLVDAYGAIMAVPANAAANDPKAPTKPPATVE